MAELKEKQYTLAAFPLEHWYVNFRDSVSEIHTSIGIAGEKEENGYD